MDSSHLVDWVSEVDCFYDLSGKKNFEDPILRGRPQAHGLPVQSCPDFPKSVAIADTAGHIDFADRQASVVFKWRQARRERPVAGPVMMGR